MTSLSSSLSQNHISEATISDYITLLKPKVMSLVIFTGFAGMYTAPGLANIHPFLAAIGIFCLAIGAGAAGAINMWLDRDIDAIMHRTQNRPLPQNRIAPGDALAFGIILSLFSVMIMALALNWMAAGLLATANLFYVFVYTIWLKRRTPQNIVIGGAAGAFPPMIGWAMVTGDISLYPILQFLIIFFWTPPHFWALSLFANEDYRRANIPMLTVTHGEKRTKRDMMIYSVILFAISLAPWVFGFENTAYALIAGALSGLFLFSNIKVLQNKNLRHARMMFGYSIFYLFALFLTMMVI